MLSFVLTNLEAFERWERDRQVIRQRYQLGTRRMAYSKLGDGLKGRALPAFLDAVARFDAVLVSVAINKRILSVFDGPGHIDLEKWGLEEWASWDRSTFEKALRVTHLAAFFIAGLSTAGQNVFWITDEDAIAADRERLDRLTEQLSYLLERYLPHQLRHLRCATTGADTGIMDLEDLAAIPDLIGGAVADLLSVYRSQGVTDWGVVNLVRSENLSPKASHIIGHLAKRPRTHKLVYIVEADTVLGQIKVSDLSIEPSAVLYAPGVSGA